MPASDETWIDYIFRSLGYMGVVVFFFISGYGITTSIMIAMSARLNELLLDGNAHLGDMMQKTLRYMNKFRKQLFTLALYHTFIAARPLDACLSKNLGYTPELAANGRIRFLIRQQVQ